MGLLVRLRDDVALRHVEVRALVAGIRRFRHHAHALARRFLPHQLLLFARDAEAAQLHLRGRLARAELDAAIGDLVERRDALGDAGRVVVTGRHQRDAVAQPDVLRALAGGGEEYFGRGGVGILFQEVVLDLKDVVEPELVGELDLVQSVLENAVLLVRVPLVAVVRLGKLMFVKETEFHDNTP